MEAITHRFLPEAAAALASDGVSAAAGTWPALGDESEAGCETAAAPELGAAVSVTTVADTGVVTTLLNRPLSVSRFKRRRSAHV